jgi:hypothetical protein
MSDRRKSSVKVADILVPQHLVTAARRNSARYSTQRYSNQRQSTIGGVPEEYYNNASDFPPIPFRQRPTPLNLEAGGRQGRESISTTVLSPRSIISPTVLQDAPIATSRRSIIIEEPLKSPLRFKEKGLFTMDAVLEKDALQEDSSSTETDDEADYAPDDARISKRRSIIQTVVPDTVQKTVRNVAQKIRKSSMYEVYEMAKERGVELERKRWLQILFEYGFYTLILAFFYFVIAGRPLWNGTLYYMYVLVNTKFILPGGWAITFGLAVL